MTFIPIPHEIYKHFKGNLYQIVAIAEHSETAQQLVIYQAMYGDFKIYARPLSMFTEKVDRVKYPDVTQEYRFELQGPNRSRQQEAAAAAEYGPVQSGAVQSGPVQSGPVQSGSVESEPAQSAFAQMALTHFAPAMEVGMELSPEVPQPAQDPEEVPIDPMVLEFLDADSYEQKLNILTALHHRITDQMITTMAIASDIEVNEGELEARYESLRSCLLTLEKYECNRLR